MGGLCRGGRGCRTEGAYHVCIHIVKIQRARYRCYSTTKNIRPNTIYEEAFRRDTKEYKMFIYCIIKCYQCKWE